MTDLNPTDADLDDADLLAAMQRESFADMLATAQLMGAAQLVLRLWDHYGSLGPDQGVDAIVTLREALDGMEARGMRLTKGED